MLKNASAEKACIVLKWLLRLVSSGVGAVFLLLFLRTLNSPYMLKAAQCAAFFALSFLPRLMHLEGTPGTAFFFFFILLAGLGGSVFALYEALPFLDNLTHFLSGILCVSVLADVLQCKGVRLGRAATAGAALTLTLAVACAWEMYEFLVFSILPHSAFSLRALAAELGVGSAKAATATAMKENLALTFATMEGLIQNEYDTFFDILCALLGTIIVLPFFLRKAKR